MRKKRISLSALCLCLLLLCGCGGGNTTVSAETGRATASTGQAQVPTGPTERVDSGFDDEVQAAIDGHEKKRFWRVETPGSFPETVSVWTFDALDVKTLWAGLREELLQDAADYTEKYYRETDSTLCSFKLDGRDVEARICPYEIAFSFVTPKRAQAFGEALTEHLSKLLGLPLPDRNEEHFSGRKYAATPELDGLPLDLHMSAGGTFLTYCGVWVDGKFAKLYCPMQKLRVVGQLSADRLLQPEEVRETLLFANLVTGEDDLLFYHTVSVFQDCQPVYRADTMSGTIRPAWRVSGKQWLYYELSGEGRYEFHPLELLVDALTGEVFVAEGDSGL